MTVGELVMERGALDLTNALAKGHLPLGGYLSVLKDLGIWDAEVLECRCLKDDYDCEAFYPTRGNWRDLGLKYADNVRVVVMKEEDWRCRRELHGVGGSRSTRFYLNPVQTRTPIDCHTRYGFP